MSRFPADFDVAAHQAKVADWKNQTPTRKPRVDYVPVATRKREMNKLEAAFAQQLEWRKAAGELMWWAYEPIRIRLADGTYYKPDFVSVDTDGRTEVWETKGLMREAARVRLNVAADLLPWRFYLVKKRGDGFSVNAVFGRIGPRGT